MRAASTSGAPVVRDVDGLTSAERAVVEDTARLEAVRAALEVNGPVQQVLNRLTAVAAATCQAPMASVSFVAVDRQVFKSAVGVPEPWGTRMHMPLQYSICKHAVASGMPLIVRDATHHPLVRRNASVRELGVRAYAGVPLVTPCGLVLGTFNVTDVRARDWSAAELDTLAELAAVASTQIAHEQAIVAAERLAAEARSRLERAVCARDENLAMTAHDMRNYLNVLALGISLLEEQDGSVCSLSPRDRERMQSAARQMDQLIQDLLDVAKLEGGRFQLRRREQPVCALTLEPVTIFRALAEQRGVSLEVETGDRLPAVAADGDAVVRVFSNLLGNAIKFTPQGGTIVVRAESEGDDVRFAVSDTGPGIAEDELPYVFDRFWQSGAHQVRGAGLGLAIAKGIVEAHGGRIWVESRRGAGTTFYFTLPAAYAHACS
jgi:signal transduction histidine kinase